MTDSNPFQRHVFAGDPRLSPTGSAAIYDTQHQRLVTVIGDISQAQTGGAGRIVLLSASEAGAGKSHLLARALGEASTQSRALPVVFNREAPPTWGELFRQALVRLAEPNPEAAPCALSETARLLFAELIGELIQKGTVPVENTNRARRGLEHDPVRLLDLRGGSPIADWFVENSTALVAPLSDALQRRLKMGPANCRAWIEFLIRFETSEGEVFVPDEFISGEAEAKAHMRQLGQLVSRYRPLVLVFDHLDAFYRDRESALSAGYLFSELARIGVAPLTIIAANNDLWKDTFAGALPGAIADRLTEHRIELRGLGIDDAQALLEARLQQFEVEAQPATLLMEAIDLDGLYRARQGSLISPRDLLRLAADAWPNGKSGEEESAENRHPDHPGTPARETLGRIQAMLTQFNKRKPGAASLEAESPPGKDAQSPWVLPDANAPTELRHFAEQRESIYLGADVVFDPDAIRHTLELAGRRSPLIEYREFHVAGGTDAASWRSPDHEILFGFEPAERTPYWRALVEQADESPLGSAKVVAFTPPGTPAFETEGLNGHAQERLDVLELDRCALASIAAAERVVSSAADEEETFAKIAPELDFLWRRITRPMGV